MASQQDFQSVPRINTPPISATPVERSSSPGGDYFTVFRSPTRSASPVTPAILSTTPTSLLRTPPVEPQSPSRGGPRKNTQRGGSMRSAHSSNRITRNTSPSDNRSTTLSPSISSDGGSFHSSDTGHSPCSLSSSEYLTPPQFQVDCDKRPYRPRRQSTDSLNMARKPKRANTMPRDKISKAGRYHRHERKYRCHHGQQKSPEYQKTDHWCIPGCQVAPTAPKGMKELCRGHVGRYKPIISIRGNTDTYGRVLPRLWSDPAPPVVSRRWSSVEIGAHQIHLASTLPANSVSVTPVNLFSDDNEIIPQRRSRPYRSSTFTRGAIDHDIVRTVREKLTLHAVPSEHLQTPTTITLRRASGASGISGVSTVTELLTPANGGNTGGSTPRPYPISQADTETDTAYLITRKEIDSITELIEANLRRNYRPHNRISAHPPTTPPSARGARSPTITVKGMIPTTTSTVGSKVTITQARASSSRPERSLNYLQVTPTSQTNSRSVSKTNSSKKSTHEVIWEPSGSPNSMSSTDQERKRSSTSDNSTHQETADITHHLHESKVPQLPQPRMDKGDAFDPSNARASISEWSWKLPQAEIPTVVQSSDSESNDWTPASEVPPKITPKAPIRSVASAPDVPKAPKKFKSRTIRRVIPAPEIEDVVSFPPLPPRKATGDWYSPLPDIDPSSAPVSPPMASSTSQSPSSRSLYDEGIDATGTISINAPKPQRPQLIPLTNHLNSSTPNIEFDPDYDLRRRSVVRAHPHTPARIGSQATMGSSIGVSSRERRKSSVRPGVQRVRTIDNIHKPSSRAGTWTRNRPPSVCPPPKTPSPAELEDGTDNSRPMSPPSAIGSGLLDRKKHDISPPLPRMDRVGIYGKITGTVRSAFGLDTNDCRDECLPKHECDDCARDPRNPSVDWIG